MREFPATGSKGVDHIAFTPDGRSLIVQTEKSLSVRDLRTGKRRKLKPIHGTVINLAVSPDGQWLAVGTHDFDWGLLRISDGQYTFWAAEEESELFSDQELPEELITVAWSPDSRQLALASDGLFHIADIGTDGRPTALQSFPVVDELPWDVAYEPSGTWVAVARFSEYGMRFGVDFWSPTGDTPPSLECPGENGDDFWMHLAPDASAVAVWIAPRPGTTGGQPTLDVWDLRSRERRFLIAGVSDDLGSVAFTAGGRLLAAGAVDGTVTVWDGHTGAVRAVYDWGIPSPKAVAFAPDGLTLAAGGSDGRVVVWDVEG